MPEDDTARLLTAHEIDLSRVWVTRERNWRDCVAQAKPKLVLVDSISVFGYGAEEEMHQAYEFAHATGITVACICHATVAGKSKGGTGPVHWSDAALVVRAKGKGRVTVDTPSKNRFGPTGPGRPVGRGSII
jgi:predicted ATP-dependent serine protease